MTAPSFSRPRLKDLALCALIALLGALLGIAINALSPRGFDMKLAANSASHDPVK